jgi:hypothetical protein
MDADEWIMSGIVIVCLAGMAVLVLACIGSMRQDRQDHDNAKRCIEHGMQWIDGSCVKVSR